VVHLHEVESLCKSIRTLSDFIVKTVDDSPSLSPFNLLPMGLDGELKNDIRIALHPVTIKYEEILLAAMQKHVAGMKVDK